MSKVKEKYIGEPMKSLMKPNLNLYQKLLEVRKSVSYLKKEAQGYGYKYVKESQLFGAIKQEMDNQGIWLDMDMMKIESIEMTIQDKSKNLIKTNGVRVTFKFTLTSCDSPKDFIVKHQILQDAASDVKSIGGLQTYANKYFLLKFFNIPNDDLDPDKFEVSVEKAYVSKHIDANQIKTLIDLIDGDINLAKDLALKFGVKSPNEINTDEYDNIHTFLTLKRLQRDVGRKTNGK